MNKSPYRPYTRYNMLQATQLPTHTPSSGTDLVFLCSLCTTAHRCVCPMRWAVCLSVLLYANGTASRDRHNIIIIIYLLLPQTLTLHRKVETGTYTYSQSFLQFDIIMYVNTWPVSCTSPYSPKAYNLCNRLCLSLINCGMSGVPD